MSLFLLLHANASYIALLLCVCIGVLLEGHAQAAFPPSLKWQTRSSRSRALKVTNNLDESKQNAFSGSPCQVYGLSEKQLDLNNTANQTSKVVDCFLASNELDMMEIRLRELETAVDVFVIVESRMTFRGNPRSLRFPSLMQRLPAMVINKVVYHVLDELEGGNTWDREIFQVG